MTETRTPAGTATAGRALPAAELPSRADIAAHYLADEARLVGALVERAVYTEDDRRRIADLARRLVHSARAGLAKHGGIDAFIREYGFTSEEGVILMCLAESLLRIPDTETADQLISEKIGGGQWDRHLGHSDSLFVNASTWGLMLTGRIVRLKGAKGSDPASLVKRLVGRSGEPVIRQALKQAMRVMGDQFVMGRNIGEAISRARTYERKGYRISYDMLGEAARTEKDAARHFEHYMEAVEAVGKAAGPLERQAFDTLMQRPGLSVKLSAIHPRFEPMKERRVVAEVVPRLVDIARAARAQGLSVTVDAEEQDRLDLTLVVFGQAFLHPALAGWSGLGLAVQAYGRRALPVIRWLGHLAERAGKRIPVRLVKGAYWDSEIKWAQERGLSDYPVFTRKLNTDVSYLAAVRALLGDREVFYPQFASHNAHTVAAAHVAAGSLPFEFQRLHGMGEALYSEIVGAGSANINRPCRIYAPVGGHEDLLAYLVRRLLENGANTSFVNRLADEEAPVAEIVRDPVATAEREREAGEPLVDARIPPPARIFLPSRANSAGIALGEPTVRTTLLSQISDVLAQAFVAGPIVDGKPMLEGTPVPVLCPHDRRERIGLVHSTSEAAADRAIASARRAAHAWDRLGAEKRAAILERAADLLEQDRIRFIGVMVREAGKTLENALGDVREAADFLRYYAGEARRLLTRATELPGPTGERNTLMLRGRGSVLCISPWNFPLAIFTGQVAAALAAGNSVIAKPAPQTPITAFLAVRVLHAAGVPGEALQLLPGDGKLGARLVGDARLDAVAFTGSNETAWAIQRALADRRSAIVPFIAETGGINAMIADSSALPEQVVRDVVRSAFDSAGQRCSAARVLFVQEDAAPAMLDMLTGAVAELDLGDPLDPATDVGPVIDERAQDSLDAHKHRMDGLARRLADVPVPHELTAGTYVGPAIYEIERLSLLEREVFGPILHVVRYGKGRLNEVVAAINATGYGLTLGLHSRIAGVADYVAEHARVGNLYVNRNQIGAVVGVQPFGGEGLSGTGPKAGGPHYLVRFTTERVRSTDITATGGNAQLLALAPQSDPAKVAENPPRKP